MNIPIWLLWSVGLIIGVPLLVLILWLAIIGYLFLKLFYRSIW